MAGGAALLLAAAPAPATLYAADFGFPEPYRGIWATAPRNCDEASPGYLRINVAVMGFHDAIGSVQSVTPLAPGKIAVTLDYVAQGKHWAETNNLTLSPKGDRLTVSGHGKTRSYTRCPTRNG